MPVRDTYPVHPDTLIIPKNKDRNELIEKRKQENKDKIAA